jgi:hypothetical protein
LFLLQYEKDVLQTAHGEPMKKSAGLFNPKRVFFMVLAVLITVIASIIFFRLFKKNKFDVSLASYDELVTFGIEELSDTRPWGEQTPPRCIGFDIRNKVHYTEKIWDSPFYLITVKYPDKPGKHTIEGYLFFKEGHYFYITYEEDHFYLKELITTVSCYGSEGELCYLPVTFHESDGKELKYDDGQEIHSFWWEETVGLSTLDDLKGYYSRLEPGVCEILDDRILLKTFWTNADGVAEWSDKYALVITVVESGINIKVTDEYKTEKRNLSEGCLPGDGK